MVYAEICAGVGGGSLGLHRAGWRAAWLNEIDRRAATVLRTRFTGIPIYATDAMQLDGHALVGRHGPIDLLVGGTPCQDLSTAGSRAGLQGTKSVIFFQLVRLWQETHAPYLLWENVSGALSNRCGKDFAAVLSALVGAPVIVPRTRWQRAGVAAGPDAVAAWRVLDAQYFGVPQRRKRVFVLAARAGGVDPAQVLLERESVLGHPAPRTTARQTAPADLGRGTPTSRARNPNTEVAAFHLGSITRPGERSRVVPGTPAPTLTTDGLIHVIPHIALTLTAHYAKGGDPSMDMYIVGNDTSALNPCIGGGTSLHVAPPGRPRRLMPVECERLMGWPDGWTDVADHKGKSASDTFRYRACGNGIVSHVTQWIGARLASRHVKG